MASPLGLEVLDLSRMVVVDWAPRHQALRNDREEMMKYWFALGLLGAFVFARGQELLGKDARFIDSLELGQVDGCAVALHFNGRPTSTNPWSMPFVCHGE